MLPTKQNLRFCLVLAMTSERRWMPLLDLQTLRFTRTRFQIFMIAWRKFKKVRIIFSLCWTTFWILLALKVEKLLFRPSRWTLLNWQITSRRLWMDFFIIEILSLKYIEKSQRTHMSLRILCVSGKFWWIFLAMLWNSQRTAERLLWISAVTQERMRNIS